MRRILVLGNSGGGKSTFARRLGEKLGLPVIHHDQIYWKAGWVPREKEEYFPMVAAASAAPAWVYDGNSASTLHIRGPRADTAIWIEQPRLLCLARAIWRAVTYREGGRPDMAEGCREKPDPEFWRYIWTFETVQRPKVEAALAIHGARLKIIRLRGDREIAAFLHSLARA